MAIDVQALPTEPVKQDNLLREIVKHEQIGWVEKNTAILVVHGIGNQLPLETLDSFGRGLLKQYRETLGDAITISHEIVTKPDGNDGVWFDNVLRIKKTGSDYFIDLYEYYWANYSQNVASWSDLNRWLQGVVNGATTFYAEKDNAEMGEMTHDDSIFFDKKTHKFKPGTYRFFMTFVAQSFLIFTSLWKAVIYLVSLIPFMGNLADSMLQSYMDGKMHDLVNVISEVAIYNVFDPKSKFYETRREILDGAVKAVTYLIERPADNAFDLKGVIDKARGEKIGEPDVKVKAIEKKLSDLLDKQELYYPSVVIAGHSLGTQVSYDAINKLDFLVNTGQVNNYDTEGICKFKNKTAISEQLRGYVTFGSPLDKVVFFLRETVPNNEFLRQQFLDNYHEFKQKNFNSSNNPQTDKNYLKASCALKRLLDDVKWRNYFDAKDYVSGSLDYYTGLTNINCQFEAGKFGFTHSYYWDCEPFYKDIISNFLSD